MKFNLYLCTMKKGILVLIAVVGLTVLSCKKADAPVQENHNDSIVVDTMTVDTVQVEEGDSVTINLDTVK